MPTPVRKRPDLVVELGRMPTPVRKRPDLVVELGRMPTPVRKRPTGRAGSGQSVNRSGGSGSEREDDFAEYVPGSHLLETRTRIGQGERRVNHR
jgi:hypothetical protein